MDARWTTCLQTVQADASRADDLGWKLAPAAWKGRRRPDGVARPWPGGNAA